MERKIFPEVTEDNKWSLDNNLEELTKLYTPRWEALTFEEKTDLCQALANIESRFLGLPPIWVKAIPIEEPHVLSY